MKPDVVIINAARGAIIDEAAMADALESGPVGLDVYERELETKEKLLGQERVLLVLHVGTHTVEMLAKMEAWGMECEEGGFGGGGQRLCLLGGR